MCIKDLRSSMNMTQAQFSEWLNIPKRTIENWEGEKSSPPPYVIELIEFKVNHSKTNE